MDENTTKLVREPKKRSKLWYIKERHNGQGSPYYSGLGQLSKTAAKRSENTLAGFNIVHAFETQEAYCSRLDALAKEGHRVL